jgi:hypothetical protein
MVTGSGERAGRFSTGVLVSAPRTVRSVDVSTGLRRGAVATALDVVDGEVREVIRRRGLDPFTDPCPVRLLVRDVVADYGSGSG